MEYEHANFSDAARRSTATASYAPVPAGPLRHRIRDQSLDEPGTRCRRRACPTAVAGAARHAIATRGADRADDAAAGVAGPGVHRQRGARLQPALLQLA